MHCSRGKLQLIALRYETEEIRRFGRFAVKRRSMTMPIRAQRVPRSTWWYGILLCRLLTEGVEEPGREPVFDDRFCSEQSLLSRRRLLPGASKRVLVWWEFVYTGG